MPKQTAGRPLLNVELPINLKEFYDLESQEVVFSPVRGKREMTIERRCASCRKQERIKVSAIRTSIKLGTLTGLCQDCNKGVPRSQPKGEASANWKGGRRITKQGYVMVLCTEHPQAKNGYVFEHRLVMERALNRLLLPSETIHHKNGVKDDNRIENLELWAREHSNGVRYEDMDVSQLEKLIVHLQQLLKDGARGQLLRIDPPTFFVPPKLGKPFKKKGGF